MRCNQDDESDAETISKDILEDIRDRSQSHPSINMREAHYNIHDIFDQRRVGLKRVLLLTRTYVQVYTRYLRTWLIIFCKLYQFLVNLAHNFLTAFQNLETL